MNTKKINRCVVNILQAGGDNWTSPCYHCLSSTH